MQREPTTPDCAYVVGHSLRINWGLKMADISPLPWRTLPQIKTGIFDASEIGKKVAATKGGHGFPEEVEDEVARANAAFIVKAVNNHERLMKALQDALCELSACAMQLNCRSGGSVVRAQEAARQVLDDVGGSGQ